MKKEINLTTTKFVEDKGFLFLNFELYKLYGITDPIAGVKKIWKEIPKIGDKPIFLLLNCGALYNAIVQTAYDDFYGSIIIYGYNTPSIIYMKILNGIWE